jgi:hypothetical protein
MPCRTKVRPSCSRGRLRACLLAHHVLGVPRGPARVPRRSASRPRRARPTPAASRSPGRLRSRTTLRLPRRVELLRALDVRDRDNDHLEPHVDVLDACGWKGSSFGSPFTRSPARTRAMPRWPPLPDRRPPRSPRTPMNASATRLATLRASRDRVWPFGRSLGGRRRRHLHSDRSTA